MAREGSRQLGQYYEGVAARYLTTKGVRVIDQNVYNRGGEIDLIGMDSDVLVFFEVRFRSTGALVDPISSISQRKQTRLVRAASFYLHRHGLWNLATRIDVIGITPGQSSKYRVQWIKNAIQAD
ncbi:YraN family protein [Marinobacter daepoensis]|uniref:YraN family protein n=1 Tax=Marinobacter daepoensis TaxID=262077 RepID=UPI0004293DDF|nr:YraN family protein [Marinobacter daepoensis]